MSNMTSSFATDPMDLAVSVIAEAGLGPEEVCTSPHAACHICTPARTSDPGPSLVAMARQAA